MCPMDQAAKVIPLVHPSHPDAITHAQRHALCEIDIVCNQQRTAATDIDNETLMARAVVVVRQQPPDEARNFDPLAIVTPGELFLPV